MGTTGWLHRPPSPCRALGSSQFPTNQNLSRKPIRAWSCSPLPKLELALVCEGFLSSPFIPLGTEGSRTFVSNRTSDECASLGTAHSWLQHGYQSHVRADRVLCQGPWAKLQLSRSLLLQGAVSVWGGSPNPGPERSSPTSRSRGSGIFSSMWGTLLRGRDLIQTFPRILHGY